MIPSKRQGAFFGLAAAVLFGISPPFAKLLLPESGPILTAGLLYLGAGLGLLFFEMTGRPFDLGVREAPVRRADAGLLAGVILTGGMLGPFLMLYGLARLSGVLTSLLLNLEAPFTVLIAVLVFREHLGRLELAGVLTIVFAAGILTYQPGVIRGDVIGIVAVLGACLCWGSTTTSVSVFLFAIRWWLPASRPLVRESECSPLRRSPASHGHRSRLFSRPSFLDSSVTGLACCWTCAPSGCSVRRVRPDSLRRPPSSARWPPCRSWASAGISRMPPLPP